MTSFHTSHPVLSSSGDDNRTGNYHKQEEHVAGVPSNMYCTHVEKHYSVHIVGRALDQSCIFSHNQDRKRQMWVS